MRDVDILMMISTTVFKTKFLIVGVRGVSVTYHDTIPLASAI